jgi:hypothetical protein
MDYNALLWVLQALIGGFCAVLWMLFNETRKRADKANEDLSQYKIFVAERYTTAEELKQAVDSINKAFESYASKLDIRLDRIEAKLDRKADKD